jgi:mono/diheme cytochrome c family protein
MRMLVATSVLACVFMAVVMPLSAQDDAEAIFKRECAMCHGASGAGDGPAAAAMNLKPISFADSAFQESRTDEQLAEAIGSGKGAMSAYGETLTPEEITALVSYIRKLGKQDR